MSNGHNDLIQNYQVFNLLVLSAEVDVLRDLVFSLSEIQTKSPPITTTDIHKKVAEKVNNQLGDLADHFPNQTRVFSFLFEQWKRSHPF